MSCKLSPNNLYEMLKSILWEKEKNIQKKSINLPSAELDLGVVKVTSLWTLHHFPSRVKHGVSFHPAFFLAVPLNPRLSFAGNESEAITCQ